MAEADDELRRLVDKAGLGEDFLRMAQANMKRLHQWQAERELQIQQFNMGRVLMPSAVAPPLYNPYAPMSGLSPLGLDLADYWRAAGLVPLRDEPMAECENNPGGRGHVWCDGVHFGERCSECHWCNAERPRVPPRNAEALDVELDADTLALPDFCRDCGAYWHCEHQGREEQPDVENGDVRDVGPGFAWDTGNAGRLAGFRADTLIIDDMAGDAS